MLSPEQKAASAARRADNRARGACRPYERVRARPIVAGQRIKITRRCHERRLFLATGSEPDKIRNFFGYTLGRSLGLYNTALHAGIQMGNHHHVDATDREGNRPDFKNSLHTNLAKGLNTLRGRFDNFWGGGGSCDTARPTDEEALEDLVYTDTNAVAAGRVKWGHQWEGFTTYGWRFGETRVFRRPDWYYDPENPDNPDFVRVTRVRPPIMLHLSDDELFDLLMEKCRARERAIQEEMAREGRRFLGVSKLRKDNWRRQPRSVEKRFQRKPKFAGSRWRVALEIQRNRVWEAAYAEARAELRRGGQPIFPYGTFYLRRHAGVRVANAPP